ncbi:MAG: tetratricopeptide repeat protein [Thermodesulfobacteriota bacterium]
MPQIRNDKQCDGLILDVGDAIPTDYDAMRLTRDAHASRQLSKLALAGGFSVPLCLVAGLYGFVSGGIVWALAGAAGGVVLGSLLGLFTHALTDGAGELLGSFIFLGSRPAWTLRERLVADIQRVRFSLGNRRFGEALSVVDQVLKKDPTNPDALYLKARIIWEGFESPAPARECLRRLLSTAPPDDSNRKWAEDLYRKIRMAS